MPWNGTIVVVAHEILAANKQPPTETGTIVEMTSRPQVHALPDYSGTNVSDLSLLTELKMLQTLDLCGCTGIAQFASLEP